MIKLISLVRSYVAFTFTLIRSRGYFTEVFTSVILFSGVHSPSLPSVKDKERLRNSHKLEEIKEA